MVGRRFFGKPRRASMFLAVLFPFRFVALSLRSVIFFIDV